MEEETEIKEIVKAMKKTKKNSDEGILNLEYIRLKETGKIFLVTEKQLKSRIILN